MRLTWLLVCMCFVLLASVMGLPAKSSQDESLPVLKPQIRSDMCKPGTSYAKDCNRCMCSRTGKEVCTKKLCRPS
ncbi:hypothetical protein J6590_075373 [Homalodisca vitripennis]|nr:hypothetical protein J6590_075373 [Homalodisca vitripennis]